MLTGAGEAREFANQLHVISGLIQVKEHDEVVRYIRAIRKHRESLGLNLSSRIGDTSVAALLMAKSSLAAERRVELHHVGDVARSVLLRPGGGQQVLRALKGSG